MKQTIPCSSAFNLLGPYLTSEAKCPECGHANVLAHIESYQSMAKVASVCSHIRALVWDENNERAIEFEIQMEAEECKLTA